LLQSGQVIVVNEIVSHLNCHEQGTDLIRVNRRRNSPAAAPGAGARKGASGLHTILRPTDH